MRSSNALVHGASFLVSTNTLAQLHTHTGATLPLHSSDSESESKAMRKGLNRVVVEALLEAQGLY